MKTGLSLFFLLVLLTAHAGTWTNVGTVSAKEHIHQFLLASNGNKQAPYSLTNEGISSFDAYDHAVRQIPFYDTKDASNTYDKRLMSDSCGNLYLFSGNSAESSIAGYRLYRYLPASAQWQLMPAPKFEDAPEVIQLLNNYSIGAVSANDDVMALFQAYSNPGYRTLGVLNCYDVPASQDNTLPWRFLQTNESLSYQNIHFFSSDNTRYSYFFSGLDVNFVDPSEFNDDGAHLYVWDKEESGYGTMRFATHIQEALKQKHPGVTAHIASVTEDAQGDVFALVAYWPSATVNHRTVPDVDLWEYQPQPNGAGVWSDVSTVFQGGDQLDFANVATAITVLGSVDHSGPIVYFAVVPEIGYDHSIPSETPVYGYMHAGKVGDFHTISEPVYADVTHYAHMSAAMGKFYHIGHDLYLFDTEKRSPENIPEPLWVLKQADDPASLQTEQWSDDTDGLIASSNISWPALPNGSGVRPNLLLAPVVTKDGRLYALSERQDQTAYDVWRYTQ